MATLVFALAVAVFGGAAAVVSIHWLRVRPLPPSGLSVPAWVALLGFTLAARFSVLERAGAVWSQIAAPELVLLTGLFAIRPSALVAAAAAGAFVGSMLPALVGVARAQLRPQIERALLQAALVAAETAVVAAVLWSHTTLDASQTDVWAAALGVMLLVRLVRVLASLAVHAVIGAGVNGSVVVPMLVATLLSCTVFSSVALLAVIVTSRTRAASALFLVVVAALAALYRALLVMRERHERLRSLHEFTSGLTHSVALHDVITSALEQTRRVLHAEGAELTLFDGQVAVRSVSGSAEHAAPVPSTSDWLWRAVLRDEQTIAVTPKSDEGAAYLATVGLRDVVAAPLLHGDGLLGIISVRDREPELGPPRRAERELFTTIADQTAIAIHAALLDRQVRSEADARARAASLDLLTGLANRPAFNDAIDTFCRRVRADAPTSAAVFVLDLNRFKDVNSVLGHEIGDALIRAVAMRVCDAVPRSATVARLGGDELAILAPGVSDVASARRFAELLQGAVEADHAIGDLVVRTEAAVGVVLIPSHGSEHATLMRRADAAMYQAKLHREGAIEVFDPDLEEISNRKLELVGDLREAIDRRGLAVHYQPKARLDDGAVVGAEALCRWIHPLHGFISPDEFIGLAEHAGLVGRLTEFVLEEALRQIDAWRERGIVLHVAVNVTPRSLREEGFVDVVSGLLARSRTEASALTLEITEGDIVNDVPAVAETLRELRRLGVQISIDDFGTGYSSLSYLARLDADEVKIDKAFVKGIVDDDVSEAIVRAVVELAGRVGMRTVAEGIEDEATWAVLARLGVNHAQGYYLSRPVTGDAFELWWHERAAASSRLLSGPTRPAGSLDGP